MCVCEVEFVCTCVCISARNIYLMLDLISNLCFYFFVFLCVCANLGILIINCEKTKASEVIFKSRFKYTVITILSNVGEC